MPFMSGDNTSNIVVSGYSDKNKFNSFRSAIFIVTALLYLLSLLRPILT
jgi:hypothetical protein